MLRAIDSCSPPPQEGMRHSSFAGFVLEAGRAFKIPEKRIDCPRGIIKQCFANAGRLAMSDPDLIYCEGFALGRVIPVHHAWCVDIDGNVIEPTWREVGGDYYGIPFDSDFLNDTVARTGHWGLIDDWASGFPLLKIDRPEFLHLSFR